MTIDTTGIASLSDLKGKRVSTGEPNSGAEEQAGYVLKALGMDWDKDITREQLGVFESVAALKDGRIDAFFWSGTVPTSAVIELSSTPDLKVIILPIGGEDAAKIMQFNPAVFHKSKFAAGSYNSMESDVDTLAVTVVLIATQNFSADHTKQVIAAIYKNKHEITAVWTGASSLTPEVSMAQLSDEARLYLHEGSVEYFKEQGALK